MTGSSQFSLLEVYQELLKNAVRATTERHRLGSNLKLSQNWTVKCSSSWMDNFGNQVLFMVRRDWVLMFHCFVSGVQGPCIFHITP